MITIIPDVSVIIQIINFIVLAIALNYLLFKPIRGIIAERAKKMATLSSEIETDSDSASAKGEQMDRELTEARRKGMGAKEQFKEEGHTEERQIIEMATKEMEKAVAEVRAQISDEIGKARDELKTQVQEFGQDLAQKILGRSIQ